MSFFHSPRKVPLACNRYNTILYISPFFLFIDVHFMIAASVCIKIKLCLLAINDIVKINGEPSSSLENMYIAQLWIISDLLLLQSSAIVKLQNFALLHCNPRRVSRSILVSNWQHYLLLQHTHIIWICVLLNIGHYWNQT